MTVTLTADKTAVPQGGKITFKAALQGVANVSDITVILKYRAKDTTTWTDLATNTTNTDGTGYGETFFPITMPSDQELGEYEFMARAEKGTAYEESAILIITVNKAVTVLFPRLRENLEPLMPNMFAMVDQFRGRFGGGLKLFSRQ